MKLVPVATAAALVLLAAGIWVYGPGGAASDRQLSADPTHDHPSAHDHAHAHAGHSGDHVHADAAEALVTLHTEPEVPRPETARD